MKQDITINQNEAEAKAQSTGCGCGGQCTCGKHDGTGQQGQACACGDHGATASSQEAAGTCACGAGCDCGEGCSCGGQCNCGAECACGCATAQAPAEQSNQQGGCGTGCGCASQQAAPAQSIGVEGMTCEHCVRSVTEELFELDGITEVSVRLTPGGVSEVFYSTDRPVERAAIETAISEAGYRAVIR